MARMPREYDSTRPSWQHVCNRVLGSPDWRPFLDESGGPGQAAEKLIELFLFYSRVFFCRLAALEVTGNDYHAVVHFEGERKVGRKELWRRAQLLWGKERALEKVRGWSCLRWKRFSQSLFQMPDMMRDLGSVFSRSFNGGRRRRGPLWMGRYKSAELVDLKAVQECLLYLELAALRAGLASRPGQWETGSARWRLRGGARARELAPLSELFPEAARLGVKPKECWRGKLLWRAAADGREAPIPEAVAREERENGPPRGCYLRRQRFFVEGVAVGAADLVRQCILARRESGFYTRRLHPVPQLGGLLHSLREQRSNARFLDWAPPGSGSRKTPLPPSRDGPIRPPGGGLPVRPPPELVLTGTPDFETEDGVDAEAVLD